jgi:hypothetical protein
LRAAGAVRVGGRRGRAVGSARRAAGRGLGGIASGGPARSGKSGAAGPRWAGSPCGFGEKSGLAELGAGAYMVGALLGGGSGRAGGGLGAAGGGGDDGRWWFGCLTGLPGPEVLVHMLRSAMVTWIGGAVLIAFFGSGCGTAAPEKCPALSQAICSTSAACKTVGQCSLKDPKRPSIFCSQCMPASDGECKVSELCTVHGQCHVFNFTETAEKGGVPVSRCFALDDADCEASVDCQKGGKCRSDGGVCVLD